MTRTAALRAVSSAVAALLAGAGIPAAAASFFNFESPQTHPVALSPDRTLLFAVNTPDNRLSVFSTSTLARVAEVPVGLEPVSVAPRPGAPEVWVVNHLSDTVDVVGTALWNVIRSIPVGDEPAAVAFTPDGSRAYVTISQRNEVVELDASTKMITDVISLETPPSFNSQDPRALAMDPNGEFLYVVPFESGNRTKGQGPPLGVPDPKGTIIFDPALGDDDLFVIRTSDNAIVDRVEGLGTILTNVRINPGNSRVYVTGWDARNLVFMVENLDGHPSINRLSILDKTTLGVIDKVDLDGPEPYARSQAVAQPSDIAFDNAGRLWVAAQGNDEVVILDADGNRLGRLPAGRAPRGMAFHEGGGLLFVFNRLSHDITVIDTTADLVLDTVPIGYDPTPPSVSEGRAFLYTAGQSGDGTQACVACHADGHHDNVVWDVGDLVDPKGPMFTQSLRGLRGNAPYHWRGERPDLLAFNVAFQDLFGGTQLSPEDNQRLADYMEGIEYPPNPNQNRNGTLSSPLARCGRQLFLGQAPVDCPPPGPGEVRQNFPCVLCHALPHGSNHAIIPASVLGTHEDMEVAQLRGLYDKVGFVHDARDRDLVEFLSNSPPFPPFPEIDKQAMELFLHEFPADHHAAVGIERTINMDLCPGGVPLPGIAGTISFLEVEATAGVIDLAVSGTMAPHGAIHFLFDPAGGSYLFDRTGPAPISPPAMIAAACAGTANLTYAGWPVGAGVRSLDRDEDAVLNGDEAGLGTDPADPDTDDDGLMDGEEPGFGTNPADPDTDGDNVLDGQEIFDGTDPTSSASSLRFLSVDLVGPSDAELVWTTVFDRRYTIEAADWDTFLTGDAVFTDLFTTPVKETESPEGTESYVDSDPPPPPGSARFYHVKALPAGS